MRMINVAYHEKELNFSLKSADNADNVGFLHVAFTSRSYYGVMTLGTAQDMLLFSISFRIFCMSSCTPGKHDDTLKVQP